MKKVTLCGAAEIPDAQISLVTIGARFEGKWLFCRSRASRAWEIPNGQRQAGETAETAARRELCRQTGVLEAQVLPVSAYGVVEDEKCTYGMLFFADVKELRERPVAGEEAKAFEVLPEAFEEPDIQKELHRAIQNWLNTRTNSGELWDVYDEKRQLTGKLHPRGEPMKKGEYHLSVYVWMLNSHGEFLITKRSPNKGFPNMWETTGGAAVAGDDSLAAALREAKEETGLVLNPHRGCCIKSYRHRDFFADVWLFRQDFDLADVVLQEGETCDKMYATPAKIRELAEAGLFLRYVHLDEVLAIVEEKQK